MRPAPIRVIRVRRPGSRSGSTRSMSRSSSSPVIVGPTFTPIGLRIRDTKSRCAPSSCRVRSPTHTKWAEVSTGVPLRESIRVSARSYSISSASCAV